MAQSRAGDYAPDARPAGRFKPHIVDVLIEERARHLRHDPLAWALIRGALYPLLRYRAAIGVADDIAPLSAQGVFEHFERLLRLRVKVSGLEHVPREGPLVIAANHPTGIVDGLALWQGLRGVRDDLSFVANRDALRVAPRLSEMLVPVEWVLEKRNLAKTRDMWRATRAAFQAGRAVVMFPSGRVAQLKNFRLVDRPWHAATITIARRNEVPILPLHIRGANSWIYYLFSRLSEELRDMTLFNELLNKRDKAFELTFGPLIPHTDLSGEPEQEIRRLRGFIEHNLPRGRAWSR